MDRITELETYIQEYREKRLSERKGYIVKNYKQMIPSFSSRLDMLIKAQETRQETGNQDKIKYLTFFRLISSNYTESYELALGMSTSMLYMDKGTTYVYWTPEIVYDSVKQDMAELEKMLRKEFLRLEAYELFYLKQLLLYDSWQGFQTIIESIVKETADKIIASSLMLENKIQVLCGDYMDKVNGICKIEIGGSEK
ncbi:hypothetical protein [Lacrimispora brassicae]